MLGLSKRGLPLVQPLHPLHSRGIPEHSPPLLLAMQTPICLLVGTKEVWLAPVFDSRKATEGSFFLALVGEHADGHDYVKDALDNGAAFALVSKPVELPHIQVEDVYKALGKLATFVRNQLPNLKVIGITGSQGKTTTKDLLQHMLESIGPTISPENSFNNELGAPLNLLRCDEKTMFCIAEVGARHIGDIKELASIVKPDIGVVLLS